MRWLLLLLIGVLAATDIFSLDLSLAPGVSVKNAVLYMVLMALFFRTVLTGRMKIDLPSIHGMFAIWIGYAILTCLVAGLIIQYPGYHLISGAISLKSFLIDPALFCLAAIWGLQDERDVTLIVKGVVGAIAIANAFTLLDVAGIVHLNIYIGDSGVQEGRVFGVFGHANDTGTLIACMLPPMIAVMFAARGLARTLWIAGIFASIAVLILTVSRGAFAAVAIGTLLGAYLCRRYISLSRLVPWLLVAAIAVVLVLAVTSTIDPYIRGIIAERILGQSQAASVEEISSGRTGLWVRILLVMMDHPISLITGFGWDVYSVMAFPLATHNWYLDAWFNVGLIGVVMFLLIMRRTISDALEATAAASPELRLLFPACVFGLLILMVGICFANLFKPWPYIWLYVGTMLRAALVVREQRVAVPSMPRVAPVRSTARTGTVLAQR